MKSDSRFTLSCTTFPSASFQTASFSSNFFAFKQRQKASKIKQWSDCKVYCDIESKKNEQSFGSQANWPLVARKLGSTTDQSVPLARKKVKGKWQVNYEIRCRTNGLDDDGGNGVDRGDNDEEGFYLLEQDISQ